MSELNKLKLDAVRIKGCVHTIGVAAKETGLDVKLSIELLRALYYQQTFWGLSKTFTDDICERALLEQIAISNFAYTIDDMLNAGLLVRDSKKSDLYHVTEQFASALIEAAQLQKFLEADGFPAFN